MLSHRVQSSSVPWSWCQIHIFKCFLYINNLNVFLVCFGFFLYIYFLYSYIKCKFESLGISAMPLYYELTHKSPASEQTEKSKESIVKAYLEGSEERYGMQCEQLPRRGEEWRWEIVREGRRIWKPDTCG